MTTEILSRFVYNLFFSFFFIPELQTANVLWSVFNRNSETTDCVIFYQHEWTHFTRQGEK